jgi:hypothetical protein
LLAPPKPDRKRAVYVSNKKQSGPIRDICFISAKKASLCDGGEVNLFLNPQVCISAKEVEANFGHCPNILRPHGCVPLTEPWSYVYKKQWGLITFIFNENSPFCLTQICIYAQQGSGAQFD